MNSFPFTKMHGLGNDFVVLETLTQEITLSPEIIQRLSNRRTGIGCDQVLVLTKSGNQADFNYRIFNADGSEAEHCGNGARCIAKFIHDNQFSNKTLVTLQLTKNSIQTEILSDQLIKVSMGEPTFFESFVFENHTVFPVSIGNPHAIIFSESSHAQLETLGKLLNQDPHFPDGVNVSIASIINPCQIKLNVFERGVGLTPACGSAACATAALAIHQNFCHGSVNVSMPGGTCTVEWPEKSSVFLSGPATTVYTGIWNG